MYTWDTTACKATSSPQLRQVQPPVTPHTLQSYKRLLIEKLKPGSAALMSSHYSKMLASKPSERDPEQGGNMTGCKGEAQLPSLRKEGPTVPTAKQQNRKKLPEKLMRSS